MRDWRIEDEWVRPVGSGDQSGVVPDWIPKCPSHATSSRRLAHKSITWRASRATGRTFA